MEELHIVEKLLGLNAISIEIDENLVCICRKDLAAKTGVLCLILLVRMLQSMIMKKFLSKKSIFVIGGVPEIGEILAESVIENVLKNKPHLFQFCICSYRKSFS